MIRRQSKTRAQNWFKIYSTNITIDEDTCTDDFYPEGITFKVNDEELDILGEDVTVTASATNKTLVPNSGIVVSQEGETRTITVTPAADPKRNDEYLYLCKRW